MKLRRCPWCGQGFFRDDRYRTHFAAESVDRNRDYANSREQHRKAVGISPAAGRGIHG